MTNKDFIFKMAHLVDLPTVYYADTTSGRTKWSGWNGTKWLFDCLCSLKSIIYWGWKEDKNALHGGAIYNSKYDFNEKGMISHCSWVSVDFTHLVPGEILYMNGHMGMYVGGGFAIETTTACGESGTVYSEVYPTGRRTVNFSNPSANKWFSHGRLPEINFEEVNERAYGLQVALKRDGFYNGYVDGDIGSMTQTAMNNAVVKYGTSNKYCAYFVQWYLWMKGFYKGDIDGIVGNMTRNSIIAWQKSWGGVQDGWIGSIGWNKILSDI